MPKSINNSIFSSSNSAEFTACATKTQLKLQSSGPQTSYYNSIEEVAAALMESLANSHGFVDGHKRIAFAATATFIEINGYSLQVTSRQGCEFIYGSLDRGEFRFARIAQWIDGHIRPDNEP